MIKKLFVKGYIDIIRNIVFKSMFLSVGKEMEQEKYRKKITFWLRFSGWFCLLPASMWLFAFRMMRGSSFSFICLTEVAIIVIFAVFVLATAKSEIWHNPGRILILMAFSFLFMPFIILIPLYFAYNASRKLANY